MSSPVPNTSAHASPNAPETIASLRRSEEEAADFARQREHAEEDAEAVAAAESPLPADRFGKLRQRSSLSSSSSGGKGGDQEADSEAPAVVDESPAIATTTPSHLVGGASASASSYTSSAISEGEESATARRQTHHHTVGDIITSAPTTAVGSHENDANAAASDDAKKMSPIAADVDHAEKSDDCAPAKAAAHSHSQSASSAIDEAIASASAEANEAYLQFLHEREAARVMKAAAQRQQQGDAAPTGRSQRELLVAEAMRRGLMSSAEGEVIATMGSPSAASDRSSGSGNSASSIAAAEREATVARLRSAAALSTLAANAAYSGQPAAEAPRASAIVPRGGNRGNVVNNNNYMKTPNIHSSSGGGKNNRIGAMRIDNRPDGFAQPYGAGMGGFYDDGLCLSDFGGEANAAATLAAAFASSPLSGTTTTDSSAADASPYPFSPDPADCDEAFCTPTALQEAMYLQLLEAYYRDKYGLSPRVDADDADGFYAGDNNYDFAEDDDDDDDEYDEFTYASPVENGGIRAFVDADGARYEFSHYQVVDGIPRAVYGNAEGRLFFVDDDAAFVSESDDGGGRYGIARGDDGNDHVRGGGAYAYGDDESEEGAYDGGEVRYLSEAELRALPDEDLYRLYLLSKVQEEEREARLVDEARMRHLIDKYYAAATSPVRYASSSSPDDYDDEDNLRVDNIDRVSTTASAPFSNDSFHRRLLLGSPPPSTAAYSPSPATSRGRMLSPSTWRSGANGGGGVDSDASQMLMRMAMAAGLRRGDTTSGGAEDSTGSPMYASPASDCSDYLLAAERGREGDAAALADAIEEQRALMERVNYLAYLRSLQSEGDADADALLRQYYHDRSDTNAGRRGIFAPGGLASPLPASLSPSPLSPPLMTSDGRAVLSFAGEDGRPVHYLASPTGTDAYVYDDASVVSDEWFETAHHRPTQTAQQREREQRQLMLAGGLARALAAMGSPDVLSPASPSPLIPTFVRYNNTGAGALRTSNTNAAIVDAAADDYTTVGEEEVFAHHGDGGFFAGRSHSNAEALAEAAGDVEDLVLADPALAAVGRSMGPLAVRNAGGPSAYMCGAVAAVSAYSSPRTAEGGLAGRRWDIHTVGSLDTAVEMPLYTSPPISALSSAEAPYYWQSATTAGDAALAAEVRRMAERDERLCLVMAPIRPTTAEEEEEAQEKPSTKATSAHADPNSIFNAYGGAVAPNRYDPLDVATPYQRALLRRLGMAHSSPREARPLNTPSTVSGDNGADVNSRVVATRTAPFTPIGSDRFGFPLNFGQRLENQYRYDPASNAYVLAGSFGAAAAASATEEAFPLFGTAHATQMAGLNDSNSGAPSATASHRAPAAVFSPGDVAAPVTVVDGFRAERKDMGPPTPQSQSGEAKRPHAGTVASPLDICGGHVRLRPLDAQARTNASRRLEEQRRQRPLTAAEARAQSLLPNVACGVPYMLSPSSPAGARSGAATAHGHPNTRAHTIGNIDTGYIAPFNSLDSNYASPIVAKRGQAWKGEGSGAPIVAVSRGNGVDTLSAVTPARRPSAAAVSTARYHNTNMVTPTRTPANRSSANSISSARGASTNEGKARSQPLHPDTGAAACPTSSASKAAAKPHDAKQQRKRSSSKGKTDGEGKEKIVGGAKEAAKRDAKELRREERERSRELSESLRRHQEKSESSRKKVSK